MCGPIGLTLRVWPHKAGGLEFGGRFDRFEAVLHTKFRRLTGVQFCCESVISEKFEIEGAIPVGRRGLSGCDSNTNIIILNILVSDIKVK